MLGLVGLLCWNGMEGSSSMGWRTAPGIGNFRLSSFSKGLHQACVAVFSKRPVCTFLILEWGVGPSLTLMLLERVALSLMLLREFLRTYLASNIGRFAICYTDA